MKKLFLVIAMLFGLLAFQGVFALANVENDTVFAVEGDFSVTFYGVVHFSTGDSTNNIYTQAIESEWLDWENSFLRIWGNAVASADVNGFIAGGSSLDLTYMSSVYTQTAFDAAGSATPKAWYALQDTIGGATKVMFKFIDPVAYERFKVLYFDGQTGNPSTVIIYWYWTVPKKPGAPQRNAYAIFNTT